MPGLAPENAAFRRRVEPEVPTKSAKPPVIETDWTDAPVLRHPTSFVHIAGRTYRLYTTGGNIHMIVLRQGGASYWVVNTLRDELSNETMIAIAKGLQPLAKAH